MLWSRDDCTPVSEARRLRSAIGTGLIRHWSNSVSRRSEDCTRISRRWQARVGNCMKTMKLPRVPTVGLEVSSELGRRVPWLTKLKIHTDQEDIWRVDRSENCLWSFFLSFPHDFIRILCGSRFGSRLWVARVEMAGMDQPARHAVSP